MLLEVRIKIIDPQSRYLDLKKIIPNSDRIINITEWKQIDKCALECYILMAWIHAQGPNGILSVLNDLGIKNVKREKFKILTQDEYNLQIIPTCVIC